MAWARVLLDWLDQPSADRGLRFLGDKSGWSWGSYAELAKSASGAAIQLIDAGVRRDRVVCLFLPTGPGLFDAIYGTWIAGGTICPLVPPMAFEEEERYLEHVARILSTAKPFAIVTSPEFSELVARALDRTGLAGTQVAVLEPSSDSSCSPRECGDLGLIQYTSGSSGTPRGVRVEFDNLSANIQAISRWLGFGRDDAVGTWLPLFHDMGLIGCLLTPTTNQTDIWVLRPDQFVRKPLEWLRCFGESGATISASPSFGYGYAARKIAPADVVGFDFSTWRVAISGSETVDATAVCRFAELTAAQGFRIRSFVPAYGLAEATLAVTGAPPQEEPNAVKLDWGAVRFGQKAPVEATAKVGAVPRDDTSGWLVGSGAPLEGMTVTVLGSGGESLRDGEVGEVFVEGSSVADGYYGGIAGGASQFRETGLATGDAGFFLDGELFVLGRIADSLKVRGRSIYADDLEIRLAAETGIPRGSCSVVVMPGEFGGSVLALGEGHDQAWATRAGRAVRSVVGAGVVVQVAVGPRGMIQRTSSGKPRRRLMGLQARDGTLPATLVVDV